MTNSYETNVEKVARGYANRCGWEMVDSGGFRRIHTDELVAALKAFAKEIAALAALTDTAPAPAISGGDVIAVLRELQTKAPEVEGPLRDAINDALEAALAAADRSAAAPAPDMVSVPRVPTEAMIWAGHTAYWANKPDHSRVALAKAYRAMLAAAPAPQQGEPE